MLKSILMSRSKLKSAQNKIINKQAPAYYKTNQILDIPSGYSYSDSDRKLSYPPLDRLYNVLPNCIQRLVSHDLLTEQQLYGVDFILSNKRVLIADSVGSGKTAQALVAADYISSKSINLPILYVTKKTLIAQVTAEVYLWTNSLTPVTYHTPLPNEILIINYEQMVNLPKQKWGMIIFDEAHMLKNRQSNRAGIAEKLSKLTTYLVLLTGTPIESKPTDLWHLLHLIDPIKFSSYWRFYNYFISYTEIETNLGKIKTDEEPKNIPILHELIKPYFIRRVYDRTEPQFIELKVDLSRSERKIYNQVEKENYIAQYDLEITNQLSRQIYLRQCAIDPESITQLTYLNPSTKLATAIDLIESLDGNVVVFSSFRQPVIKLHSLIRNSYLFLDRSEFDNPPFYNYKVLLSTFSSLGTGANLQLAQYCVILDLPNSSIILKQAVGRLIRIGQKHQPIFFVIHANDTIDQRISTLMDIKVDNFKNIVIEKET